MTAFGAFKTIRERGVAYSLRFYDRLVYIITISFAYGSMVVSRMKYAGVSLRKVVWVWSLIFWIMPVNIPTKLLDALLVHSCLRLVVSLAISLN